MADLWYPGAVKHDMRPVTSTFWAKGKPINILHHFTAGCGGQFPGGERFHPPGDGVGSPFGIKRDGTVLQYVPAQVATWHAFGESHYGIGIELDANPAGGCPVLPVQLEAEVKLVAWLCKAFGIPAVRAPGVAYSAGLKCHTDGLENSQVWDMNGHYDSPFKCAGDPTDRWVSAGERAALNKSPWAWSTYIPKVQALINPPPPPPPPPGGGRVKLDDENAQQLDYAHVGDWEVQALRDKAVNDYWLGYPKRTGQPAAYGEAFDKMVARHGPQAP